MGSMQKPQQLLPSGNSSGLHMCLVVNVLSAMRPLQLFPSVIWCIQMQNFILMQLRANNVVCIFPAGLIDRSYLYMLFLLCICYKVVLDCPQQP